MHRVQDLAETKKLCTKTCTLKKSMIITLDFLKIILDKAVLAVL